MAISVSVKNARALRNEKESAFSLTVFFLHAYKFRANWFARPTMATDVHKWFQVDPYDLVSMLMDSIIANSRQHRFLSFVTLVDRYT